MPKSADPGGPFGPNEPVRKRSEQPAPNGVVGGDHPAATEASVVVPGFRTVKFIGHGGMGQVFKAVQLSTSREVALKLLPRHMGRTARQRFEREIRVTSRLEHANIVRIYDAGVADDCCYLAMELVRGMPLHHYVKKCHPHTGEILGILIRVARAVGYAHRHGVVHRDLKPSNILIDDERDPRVIDFGIAKAFDDADTHFVTRDGQPLGTLAYMSPEQAVGDMSKVDHRSDIYSLGAILYELVTGRLPHDMDGPMHAVVMRIASEPVPSPSSLGITIDTQLETILMRALARSPQDRYESARDFANVLHDYLKDTPRLSAEVAGVTSLRPMSTYESQGSYAAAMTDDKATHASRTMHQTAAFTRFVNSTPKMSVVVLAVVALFAVVVGAVFMSNNRGAPDDGVERVASSPQADDLGAAVPDDLPEGDAADAQATDPAASTGEPGPDATTAETVTPTDQGTEPPIEPAMVKTTPPDTVAEPAAVVDTTRTDDSMTESTAEPGTQPSLTETTVVTSPPGDSPGSTDPVAPAPRALPEPTLALVNQAKAAHAEGKLPEAIAIMKQAQLDEPGEPVIEDMMRDWRDELAAIDPVEKQRMFKARFNAARDMRAKDPEGALRVLRAAQVVDPNDAFAIALETDIRSQMVDARVDALLEEAKLLRMTEPKKALGLAEQACKLNPEGSHAVQVRDDIAIELSLTPALKTLLASARKHEKSDPVQSMRDLEAFFETVNQVKDEQQIPLYAVVADARELLKVVEARVKSDEALSKQAALAKAADEAIEKAQALRESDPSAAILELATLLESQPDLRRAESLLDEIQASFTPEQVGHKWVNDIGMVFTYIPAGQFHQGSPPSEVGRGRDEGQRRVRISSPYLLQTTEVTQQQWRRVMGNGSDRSRFKNDKPPHDMPVSNVTWEQAVDFCEKLGAMDGNTYRLPTEAEWEYACRAGSPAPFSTGGSIDSKSANLDFRVAYGRHREEAYVGRTIPVGSLKPNDWGLYDMHGNVWEWCSDHYDRYDTRRQIIVDPKGPDLNNEHVRRGGAWYNDAASCRSANRTRDMPDNRFDTHGFEGLRVVVERSRRN